mmetsp:Transcript_53683/g.60011  ORF Transcript_53683/g.60011 Transcript_53683/m.60011 type:complete len:157 (-) Transcript_53683:87-557(-)
MATTTTIPRFHDRKRMKHSAVPIHDFHRRSSFRYCSSIHKSGTSLNSILEVGDHQDARRREKATTTCTTSSSSRLVSRSASTPLPFTDFWHSTRTMKKTQTCTSLSGLLDLVSMDDDDDDEEEEIDEDFDKDKNKKKMDVDVDDDDDENCEGGFQF